MVKVIGNGIVEGQSVAPGGFRGDANGDGLVGIVDYAIWKAHYGLTTLNGPADGDFNSDGVVDNSDFDIMVATWGSYVAPLTPEGILGLPGVPDVLYVVDAGDGPLEFIKQGGTYSGQAYYKMAHGFVTPPSTGKNDFPRDLYLFWAGGPDAPGSPGLWAISDVLGSIVGSSVVTSWDQFAGAIGYLPLCGPLGVFPIIKGGLGISLTVTTTQPW